MTRQDVIALVESLGLPAPIQQLVRGEPLPGALRTYFGFPEEFILMSDAERAAHGWVGIVPLWDDGNFGEVVAYWPAQEAFLRFDVEDRFELASARTYNLQQAFLPYFIRVYEGELPDDEFRKLAEACEFRYAEEIISAYRTADLFTAERHGAWQANLEERMRERGRPTKR